MRQEYKGLQVGRKFGTSMRFDGCTVLGEFPPMRTSVIPVSLRASGIADPRA